jgi:RNA polymerase sigma-70 factor (ECF subfamily)
MSKTSHNTEVNVDHLFREEAGKMTAILIRLFGFKNAELAEDIVQETFISALKSWPIKGEPYNPSAWLMQVAKNKAINVLKREQRIQSKAFVVASTFVEEDISELFSGREITDSQLRMLFTCCYEEIQPREQIMLILNTLGGLNNAEIGYALFLSSAAVKKAIYRAKEKVRGRHQKLPEISKNDIKERSGTVLQAIYLIFNEGYRTSLSDAIVNEDLCFTALRLAQLMLNLDGINVGEVHALLSLMYFNIARFPARNEGNEIINLKEQDRSKWDKKLINRGFYHFKKSRSGNQLTTLHLESSIASLHCSANSFKETNWEMISICYKKLLDMSDSSMIRINYAIAVSYWKGSQTGLQLLDDFDLPLPKQKRFYLSAAKGEMNARLRNFSLAKSYYQVAADQANTKVDINYLQKKIEECDRKSFSKN